MESLVANYASSDDEEQDPPIVSGSKIIQTTTPSSNSSFLLSSLPQPKSSTPPSSSLFQSLPQPKQTPKLSKPLLGVEEERSSGAIPSTSSSKLSSLPQPKQISSKSNLLTSSSDIHHDDREDSEPSSKFSSSTSLFSSLPQPMSQSHQPPVGNPSSSGQKNKRVVRFPPLLNPNPSKTAVLDEDDDDEEQERKTSTGSDFMGQAPSVTSFLSSLPAARNTATLGVQATSVSGRKAIIETDTPALDTGSSGVENNVVVDQNAENYVTYDGYAHYPSELEHNVGNNNVSYDVTTYYQPGFNHDAAVPSQTGVTGSDNSYYGNYDTRGCYNGYVDYGQYGNNWADGSGMGMQEESGVSEDALKLSGKRGRSQVPEEIIEVKQDELMKNRPREDQTKLTGIAFGPSYKPVSTKGKPSKLHKRKHQISSLYFDMKQKEMELAERRARGMLTKAETQAKYGW